MGPDEMMPELPAGFQLEGDDQTPPLPAGFEIEAPTAKQAAPDVGVAEDVAKSAGIGVVKGGISLAGLPGDLSTLLNKGIDYGLNKLGMETPASYRNPLGSAAIRGGIEGITGPLYEPKTTAGEYAQTFGEFAPAMMGGPASLGAKFATRVAAPALVSETAGQATEGTAAEPYARVAGALLGSGAPAAIGRAVSPMRIANADAVNALKGEGVTALTAGQQSGSKVLKYAESELGDSLFAGGKATKANEAALEQFTAASARKAGINANRVTPEVLDEAFTNTGNKFDATAKAAGNIPLGDFSQKAKKIATEFKNLTGADSPLLKSLISRITEVPAEKLPPAGSTISKAEFKKLSQPTGKAAISGESYQAIQSEIGAMARRASNPELKFALHDLKNELDDAIARGLKDPKLAEAWREARHEYKNLLVIERASGKDPTGLISPAALHQAAQQLSKRAFNRGKSDFTELAKAGKAVMAPLPQSGTAPRAAVHFLPSILAGLAGSGIGAIPGIAAGAFGPAIAGRALMSAPVQRYLTNQVAAPLRRPSASDLLTSGILGGLAGR